MTAAILGGAGAIAVIAVVLLVLALELRAAERRAADARVADADKAGRIAVDAATIATLIAAVATEKGRADALDDVLDEVATSGDAAGARARVLQRWAKARHDPAAAGDHGGGAVPADPAPARPGSGDDLLPPGS